VVKVVDTLFKTYKDAESRESNSDGARDELKASLLNLSDIPRFVLSNAEAEYRRATLEPVTRSSTDLRRDISRKADPSTLAVWRAAVSEGFDALWTSTVQAKEASEVEKKVNQANKRKQRKGTILSEGQIESTTDSQHNNITSMGGDSSGDAAGGGIAEALDSTPTVDAQEDDEGKDWRTCSVTLKQALCEELSDEDNYDRILSLLDNSQTYATDLEDAVYTMVLKETILVSCANLRL